MAAYEIYPLRTLEDMIACGYTDRFAAENIILAQASQIQQRRTAEELAQHQAKMGAK